MSLLNAARGGSSAIPCSLSLSPRPPVQSPVVGRRASRNAARGPQAVAGGQVVEAPRAPALRLRVPIQPLPLMSVQLQQPQLQPREFFNHLVPFPTRHSTNSRISRSPADRGQQLVQTAQVAPPAAAGSAAIRSTIPAAAVRDRRKQRLVRAHRPEAIGTAGELETEAQPIAAPKAPRRSRNSRLSAAEEQMLATAVEAGGAAAAAAVVRLVESNRALVHHLARRFEGRGVDTQDLVAEGLEALERAAAAYRPGGNARFATFAALSVWRSMQRGVHQYSRNVRLPASLYADLRCLNRARDELRGQLQGQEPGIEAVAARCGFTVGHVARILRTTRGERSADGKPAAEGQAQAAESAIADALALDSACDEDSQEGERQERFEALQSQLQSFLQGLPVKQQQAVSLRWGLLDGRKRTFKEVGEAIGVSGARACQIYTAAEQRLRAEMASPEGSSTSSTSSTTSSTMPTIASFTTNTKTSSNSTNSITSAPLPKASKVKKAKKASSRMDSPSDFLQLQSIAAGAVGSGTADGLMMAWA